MPPDNNVNNEPTDSSAGQEIQAPAAGSTPVTPITPVTVGTTSGSQPVEPSKKKFNLKSKKFLIILAAVLLLLVGSASAFFVVQNRPEKIWQKALKNTSKGYDKLVEYAEGYDQKGAKISGKFKYDDQTTVVDGNISGRVDETDLELKIDAGAAGQRLNLDLLAHAQDANSNPDVYVRISGFAGLSQLLAASGDPSAAQMGEFFAGFENQWYFIDHTFFDQMEKEAEGAADTPAIKKEDIVNFAKTFGEVNNEYVFTTDNSKAVFDLKQSVGKEKLDGRDTHRFKVGLNKQNLKNYNKALCDKLLQDKFYKEFTTLFGQTEDQVKDECYDTEDIDKIDESRTADVWVDLSTKTIHKIRFTEKDNPNSHVDVGLEYEGEDDITFVISFIEKQQDIDTTTTIKVSLNTKTNKLSFNVVASGTEGGQKVGFELSADITPSDEDFEITKPEGAKSFIELLSALFGGSLFTPPSADPSQPPVDLPTNFQTF